MSTYYTRPRQPLAPPPPPAAQPQAQHEQHSVQLPSLDIELGEQSIYIFPNPSSVPPSPGSSLFSTPTDIPSSLNSSAARLESYRRPRGLHHASSFSVQSSSSRSGSASTGAGSYLHIHHSFSPTTPTDTDPDAYTDGDGEVELWDWTGDSMRSAAGEGSEPDSWVLEEEIQRASRWGLVDEDTHVRGRPFPLQASSTARVTLDNARHRLSLAPLRSSTSSCSNSSLRSGNASTPQPRIRIPLLSFFAALLSLDLDDPALRLLTQPAPPDGQSILFPGHLASSLSADLPSSDIAKTNSATRSELSPDQPPGTHGLQKLLLFTTEPAGAALRSLRAGLAIPIEIDLPGVTGLAGLFRVVGEVYHRSGQAWKEVWVST